MECFNGDNVVVIWNGDYGYYLGGGDRRDLHYTYRGELRTNNIKPFVEFKQNGFIIQGKILKMFINSNVQLHKIHENLYNIIFHDHCRHIICCTAEDGQWFWENYMNCNDGSAELSLKRRICALEDKLKVLTEMMDKNGL